MHRRYSRKRISPEHDPPRSDLYRFLPTGPDPNPDHVGFGVHDRDFRASGVHPGLRNLACVGEHDHCDRRRRDSLRCNSRLLRLLLLPKARGRQGANQSSSFGAPTVRIVRRFNAVGPRRARGSDAVRPLISLTK